DRSASSRAAACHLQRPPAQGRGARDSASCYLQGNAAADDIAYAGVAGPEFQNTAPVDDGATRGGPAEQLQSAAAIDDGAGRATPVRARLNPPPARGCPSGGAPCPDTRGAAIEVGLAAGRAVIVLSATADLRALIDAIGANGFRAAAVDRRAAGRAT